MSRDYEQNLRNYGARQQGNYNDLDPYYRQNYGFQQNRYTGYNYDPYIRQDQPQFIPPSYSGQYVTTQASLPPQNSVIGPTQYSRLVTGSSPQPRPIQNSQLINSPQQSFLQGVSNLEPESSIRYEPVEVQYTEYINVKKIIQVPVTEEIIDYVPVLVDPVILPQTSQIIMSQASSVGRSRTPIPIYISPPSSRLQQSHIIHHRNFQPPQYPNQSIQPLQQSPQINQRTYNPEQQTTPNRNNAAIVQIYINETYNSRTLPDLNQSTRNTSARKNIF